MLQKPSQMNHTCCLADQTATYLRILVLPTAKQETTRRYAILTHTLGESTAPSSSSSLSLHSRLPHNPQLSMSDETDDWPPSIFYTSEFLYGDLVPLAKAVQNGEPLPTKTGRPGNASQFFFDCLGEWKLLLFSP